MLCERCHKKMATMKYTEVVKGKAVLRNICEVCMEQLQADPAAGFETAGAPAANLIRARRTDAEETLSRRKCDNCGTPMREVTMTGRVGCEACYGAFRESIGLVVRGLHLGARHEGKRPLTASGHDDQRERLWGELRTQRSMLRSALKVENYEEAAQLRDRIRHLEDALGAEAGRN